MIDYLEKIKCKHREPGIRGRGSFEGTRCWYCTLWEQECMFVEQRSCPEFEQKQEGRGLSAYPAWDCWRMT